MCGRFTLGYDAHELAEAFEVDNVPAEYGPRSKIPSGTAVAVVGLKPDGVRRGLVLLHWGFVPRWADDPKAGPKPINARSETAADRSPFRDSFRDRRCLIPASGFYEWSAAGGTKKVPYQFTPTTRPVAFAGLWDYRKGPPVFRTCAILTTAANAVVRPYHDRMPVMLTADRFAEWLDPAAPADALRRLLIPFPDDALTVAPADLGAKPAAPDLFNSA